MKRSVKFIGAALLLLLAGCGKEGDPTCKEGEYPVNDGLSCCPVGTEFKAGLCAKPEQAATVAPQTQTPPTTTTVTPQPPPTSTESQPPPAEPPPTVTQTVEPPPTTQPPTPPTPQPPPTPAQVDLMAIEGTWLFANLMTGNSCSPEEKGKTNSEVIILERNGQAIADRGLSGILPGCQKLSDTELSGVISSTGIFSLSKRSVSSCSQDTVTVDFSYSGKFDGTGLVGTQSVIASYSQSGAIVRYCTFSYTFTATR